MNSKYSVKLTEEQRADLSGMLHAGIHAARQLNRARVLLLADEGEERSLTDPEIAKLAMVSRATVANIRRRFVVDGLDVALQEKPRPGRPPKITGDVEAQLVVLACSDPPEGHAAWTLRLLTSELIALGTVEDLSHVAVSKALKKTNSNLGRPKRGA